MLVTASRLVYKAPVRAMTRGSPNPRTETLDLEGCAVLQVLLDPRVLVEGVDAHALVPVDRGVKRGGRVPVDHPSEDDLNVVGGPM
jgi:hypothetical protein